MNISRPRLQSTEARDKRPLGRDPGRGWCHRHTSVSFLVAIHGFKNIGGSIRARQKVVDLAYNRCETRGKRPLDRDPERGCCHHRTSVKLCWLQPMDTWAEWQHTRMLPPMFMESWAATKKLYTSVEMTPAPVRVPNQSPLVPSFTLVVG